MDILTLSAKCAGKLHIGKIVYRLLKPFFHSRIEYNQEEVDKAYDYLSQLSPNPDNSAICSNTISDCPYELQIIIPAYNVEKYVEECINSVISQVADCNYICTVINDGSTDNTGDILHKFAHLPQIEIINQENRGFSGARNRGLEIIKGKYIMFLDSDDKLAPGAINALLHGAKETKADIIEGGYIAFNNKQDVTYKFIHKNEVSDKWLNLLYGYPWGKIYKAELFQNLHFPEKYWFEDTLMSLLVYPKCKKIATISDVVYMYRINPSGICATVKRNVKSLDTLWITWRLLKDRDILHLSNGEDLARFILFQFSVNQNRLHSLGVEDISKNAFIVSIYLYEKFFNIRLSDEKIYDYLIHRDFNAFKLYCIFNN